MWEYLWSVVLSAAVWDRVLEPQVMQGLSITAFQYNKVHVASLHITVSSAWSLNQGWGPGAKARQHKETSTEQDNYGYPSKPGAGSFIHFLLISSFSFVSIMQNISQEGKVPGTFFFLTTLQNSTSDGLPLCCQWYNKNPLALLGSWRIPLDQMEFLKLHSFYCQYVKTI